MSPWGSVIARLSAQMQSQGGESDCKSIRLSIVPFACELRLLYKTTHSD